MTKIRELKGGDYFGENALLQLEKRITTTQCHQKCLLAVLKRSQYEEILKKELMNEVDINSELMRNYNLFDNING